MRENIKLSGAEIASDGDAGDVNLAITIAGGAFIDDEDVIVYPMNFSIPNSAEERQKRYSMNPLPYMTSFNLGGPIVDALIKDGYAFKAGEAGNEVVCCHAQSQNEVLAVGQNILEAACRAFVQVKIPNSIELPLHRLGPDLQRTAVKFKSPLF